MGNWGDDTDPEVAALKEYNGRFTVNFKKIYIDVDELTERTLEITDKHPKDSLLKMWAGAMLGFFVLFMLSYQILLIISVPFMVFYLLAVIRIGKAWKGFKYNNTHYILMTVFTLLGLFAIAMVVQWAVLNFVL